MSDVTRRDAIKAAVAAVAAPYIPSKKAGFLPAAISDGEAAKWLAQQTQNGLVSGFASVGWNVRSVRIEPKFISDSCPEAFLIKTNVTINGKPQCLTSYASKTLVREAASEVNSETAQIIRNLIKLHGRWWVNHFKGAAAAEMAFPDRAEPKDSFKIRKPIVLDYSIDAWENEGGSWR